jgi:hypothetical protein
MTSTPSTLTTRANAAREEANRLDGEARALSAQLDAEQRALVERQRPFVEAAEAAAVREALAAIDSPQAEPRPWAEVLADPAVGIDGLFVAFCEMRSLAAARAAAVTAGGNILDSTDPRTDADGERLPWRGDIHDRLEGALFLPVVQEAIEIRTRAAAGAAGQAIAAIANAAGAAAAAKIK